MSVADRMKELGIELPPLSAPVGNYVQAVQTGNLVFLAGKGPGKVKGTVSGKVSGKVRGKVGRELSVEEGYQAARACGLMLLAALADHLGSLDRVTRVVKVLGMVNADPEFGEHPKVINGCSDLMVEVFGDKGRHARSAVGMGSLPAQIPVEIEAIFEVD